MLNVPSVAGALIGILTLRDVREGEELLMDYGERYWQERSQTGKTNFVSA